MSCQFFLLNFFTHHYRPGIALFVWEHSGGYSYKRGEGQQQIGIRISRPNLTNTNNNTLLLAHSRLPLHRFPQRLFHQHEMKSILR